MPYIKQELRKLVDDFIDNINDITNSMAMKTNRNSLITYIVYRIIKTYDNFPSWEYKSDALKVLEDVKLEYYRKVLAPHADRKILENGDIE